MLISGQRFVCLPETGRFTVFFFFFPSARLPLLPPVLTLPLLPTPDPLLFSCPFPSEDISPIEPVLGRLALAPSMDGKACHRVPSIPVSMACPPPEVANLAVLEPDLTVLL